MARVGFHASHEQLAPSALLAAAKRADQAGFDAVSCSDHIAPWGAQQGHSGFAWSWLGSALEATSVPCGVVNAPVQRYHPAVIAQAIATLSEMYPGRFWTALGSGEALNEHITGERWPDKPTRDRRLLECVDVIKALLAGEEVTHDGLVTVDRARLWDLPSEPPMLVGAAVSEATARTVGGWADALITINQPHDVLRKVFDAFHEGGGEGKPIFLQVHLSWDPDEGTAEAVAHEQWRTNVFDSSLAWNLELPEQFDAAATHVTADDVREKVLVSSDLGRQRAWLQEYVELGVDSLYLHHVGQTQDGFIDAFADRVLPELQGSSR
ncbi:MAG TPA: TIGR03885 family FMN-dependent LLM class oxidoreductase [Acidimicrobiales bacterium]|nr:TIGR03885 family FMN-dependent LLM class oxidoreductase [Acidimicrobiales bacterium]